MTKEELEILPDDEKILVHAYTIIEDMTSYKYKICYEWLLKSEILSRKGGYADIFISADVAKEHLKKELENNIKQRQAGINNLTKANETDQIILNQLKEFPSHYDFGIDLIS